MYEEASSEGASVYLEPEDFSDIAEYYHIHGRLAEALEAVDLALQTYPGATAPLAFRARIAILVEHNVNEAMRYANMIADKQDLEYFYIVAEIMIADGKPKEAEQYLDDMEKTLDDEDLEDFHIDVATLFADYDLYDAASSWFALCQDTDEEDCMELRGRIELNLGHYKESIEIFNRLIDRNPYQTQYWNNLSSAYYFSNNLSESIECCDYALAIDPDDYEALLNKANSLTMLGNYDQAMEYYRHYQRLQPMSEVADMGMAAVLMAQNKIKPSLEHWQRAAELCSPHSTNAMDICRNLCILYASTYRFNDAMEVIDKIEAMGNGETPDTLVMRGYVRLSADDKETADIYFNTAYSNASDNERDNIVFSVAYSYFDCGYMREAHDSLCILTASETFKDNVEIWTYLARTDYELGLDGEFLNDLKQAIDLNASIAERDLAEYFPEGMAAHDYYEYALHHKITKK